MNTPRNEPDILLTVADPAFQIRWDFCVHSHKAYAARHGLTHIIYEAGSAGLNLQWSKLWYILKHLENGQNIFFVDADAAITPATPYFKEWMDKFPEKSLFIAHGISGRPNSGVMMLRPTGRLKEFLRHVLNHRLDRMPPEDYVSETDENGHLIHFLKEPRFAPVKQELELSWNCSRPEVKGAYIYHFTNHLRNHLLSNAGFAGFSHSFCPPKNSGQMGAHENYQAKRAQWLRNPALFEQDRVELAKTTTRSDLHFPAKRGDAPIQELWRYEFATGLLEYPSVELLRRILAADHPQWALDGGAHVGYYSLLLESLGYKVAAIEANPENLELLTRNVSPATRKVPRALSSAPGTATFYLGTGHTNSSLVKTGVASNQQITVQCQTLDAIAAELNIPYDQVDFIKLDVEGYELPALQGAARILNSSAGLVILCELNPQILNMPVAAPALAQLLYRQGFHLRRIGDDFTLGPLGFIDALRNNNYLFAREEKWREIMTRLGQPPEAAQWF